MESLGLDEKEIFNACSKVPSIHYKDQFPISFIELINDPQAQTGALETNRSCLRSIIVFDPGPSQMPPLSLKRR